MNYIYELKNYLEVLIDFKNKLKTTLDIENNNLFNLKEQIGDIGKPGQTNPFNIYNTLKPDETDLDKFINIAGNNITIYENEPIFRVITDAGKDNYPFILKGNTTVNDGEPVEINCFQKTLIN